MNLSRVLLSGFMLTLMGSAFADNAIISSTEVIGISRPSVFSSSQIDQIQTTQDFNTKSRDHDTNQQALVRRENVANSKHSLKENNSSGGNDYFLANTNLGSRGYIPVDSRGKSGKDYPVGPADDYDLNGFQAVNQNENNPQYIYYKQSITVVSPDSPLYEGQAIPVTTGQQVANRNANQNALFFCTGGNRAQTAEFFKQIQSADLSVWKDLGGFNKCKAWADLSSVSQKDH